MPFLDGVYYPFTSDTPGTHSSAGIPSLLTSPLSHSAPGMTPSGGASGFPAFKFRPRRGSVDWRRINALDMDFVVSQVDVDAIQEHISMVMLCSLEGERCQRCQSPVDPALLKLLQLAQLSVEWLLHCQEYLALNLQANEERLLAAGKEREQLLAQLKKQEEGAKTLTAELKHAKKLLRTQQSLFSPHIGSLKCQLCNKTFIHSSFLQGHMQRRHPDEYESHVHSDSEKQSQMNSLKLEIGSLKEQIAQQQQTLQAKVAQEKEQQFLHNNLLRELDRFKAEEMARMDRKIEDSRDGMRREMELLYNRNIQALNEVNQNQKPEKAASPVQPERDLDIYKEMQTQTIQKLEQQMKKQDKKWESRLQSLKGHHEAEKNQLLNELSRVQSSVSDHQDNIQRLQQEMTRRLQEKEQTIKSQREQIRSISANPPTKVIEVPVLVSAPAPEPAPKRVVVEEPASAPKLDPIQELSEEDRDSSSMSERRPAAERKLEPVPEKKAKMATSSLKKNPMFKKGMRPELEQSLVKKLENLGVRPDQRGLKNRELASILTKLQLKRENAAKGMPDYWRIREEFAGTVEQKLHRQRRGSDPALETQARTRPLQVLQIRPRSSSLPARETKPAPGTASRQAKTPQAAPRTKTQTKTPTANMKTALKAFKAKTPPFSSDSEADDMDVDDEPPLKQQRGKAPQARLNPTLQVRSGRLGAGRARDPPTWQPSSSSTNPNPGRDGARGGAGTVAARKDSGEEEDDEYDWVEVSELEEIDPGQLQAYKDPSRSTDMKHLERKISDLAKKMERQFTERVTKKPVGGVSILPERKDQVQELLYTDLEESNEWGVSSLEEQREKPKLAPRKSLDSPSTSIWGTSTGRPSKSGLTDTGAGSTLKSTLCSLSDFSDTDDK